MNWTERIIGIVLGLVLGVAVVVVFVFVYSEQTVDAPSISREADRPPRRAGGGGERNRGRPAPPPVTTIRIVGGAPPPTGPAELDYRRGQLIRMRLLSDATVVLQLVGYGIETTVEAGRPRTLEFTARKTGDFPLVVTASHIDVATITVRGRCLRPWAGYCRIAARTRPSRRSLVLGWVGSRVWRFYLAHTATFGAKSTMRLVQDLGQPTVEGL